MSVSKKKKIGTLLELNWKGLFKKKINCVLTTLLANFVCHKLYEPMLWDAKVTSASWHVAELPVVSNMAAKTWIKCCLQYNI